MNPGLRKPAHPLVKALSTVKSINPLAYDQLRAGLHALLDPELLMVLRVPPEIIHCAQGRGQVAQEVLSLFDRVDEFSHELEQLEKQTQLRATNPELQPKWRG